MSDDKLKNPQRMKALLLLLFAAVAFLGAGCERSPAAADAKTRKDGKHTLGIVGFNYTNRTIGSFSVDGVGGDILRVSSPTSAGGGTVCCIGWRDGTPLPVKMTVRWTADSCMRQVTNQFGESRDAVVDTYADTVVEFNGPVPTNPQYLEVHFYPDGRIVIEITDDMTEPRLKLDPDRRERPARCKDEVKHER